MRQSYVPNDAVNLVVGMGLFCFIPLVLYGRGVGL